MNGCGGGKPREKSNINCNINCNRLLLGGMFHSYVMLALSVP